MKLCDLNTAKVLQELGYDGEYFKTYTDFDTCTVDVTGLKIPTEIPAPRLNDVAYWLRDKHKISIEPMYLSMAQEWRLAAYNMAYEGVDQLCVVYGKDYDSALEAAVTKTIEIININTCKQKIMDAKGRYRKELAKAIKQMQTTESKTHKPKSDDRGTTAQA